MKAEYAKRVKKKIIERNKQISKKERKENLNE